MIYTYIYILYICFTENLFMTINKNLNHWIMYESLHAGLREWPRRAYCSFPHARRFRRLSQISGFNTSIFCIQCQWHNIANKIGITTTIPIIASQSLCSSFVPLLISWIRLDVFLLCVDKHTTRFLTYQPMMYIIVT